MDTYDFRIQSHETSVLQIESRSQKPVTINSTMNEYCFVELLQMNYQGYPKMLNNKLIFELFKISPVGMGYEFVINF